MAAEKCEIVTLESGNRYVWLPDSQRLFSNYKHADGVWRWVGGKRVGQGGTSLLSMSRHFYTPIKSHLTDQDIPDEVKTMMMEV